MSYRMMRHERFYGRGSKGWRVGALLLTMLLGASVLVIAKFFPRTRNGRPDKAVTEENPTSSTTGTGTPDGGRFSYVTVVLVLFATWAVLTLAAASPLIFIALLFVLASGLYATYRIRHGSLGHRDIIGRLLSDMRRLAARVLDDFWTSFVRLRSWYRERQARMERERAAQLEKQAQERERLARERERLAQLERQRRARPYNDHLTIGEYEDIQRNLQREQQQHAERMEQARVERERRKQFIEWMNRQNRR